jgi:hypothetical protein
MNLKLLAVAGLALFFLGSVLGYRHATGRCAVNEIERVGAINAAVANALEVARVQHTEEAAKLAASMKAEATRANRQTSERTHYETAPSAPSCVLPDATFRLLVDAIHRANAAANPAFATRGVRDALPDTP